MKNLLFLFALLIGSYSVYSQTPLSAEEKADQVVAKLKNDIQLTDEQVPKVKAITVDRINKVTDATKKYGKDKNRLQAANKLIFQDWETQLKGIITPEQLTKYQNTKK